MNEKAPPLSGGASQGNLCHARGNREKPRHLTCNTETLTKGFGKRARVKTGFRGPQSSPDKTIVPNEDRQS
jgi:hypothetical protein